MLEALITTPGRRTSGHVVLLYLYCFAVAILSAARIHAVDAVRSTLSLLNARSSFLLPSIPCPQRPILPASCPPSFFFLSSFLCDSLRHSFARSLSHGRTSSHALSIPRNFYFGSRILSLFLSPHRPLSLAHDRFQQFFSMLDSDKDEAYPPTHKAYWNAADAYLMGNVTPGGTRKHSYTQVHRHTHTHSHTHAHAYKRIHAHTYTYTLAHPHPRTVTQAFPSECLYVFTSSPPFTAPSPLLLSHLFLLVTHRVHLGFLLMSVHMCVCFW